MIITVPTSQFCSDNAWYNIIRDERREGAVDAR